MARLPTASFHKFLWVLMLVAALALGNGPSQAQTSSAPVIETITVEGTQRIDPETVRTYMTVAPGDPLDAGAVNESLKRLFGTGFFANVEIIEGTDRRSLTVRVKENPIISRVAFEGNLRIKDEDLRPEVQTQPRAIYTRSKIQDDVQRILNVYRRSGRFAATVEPKLIEQPQNRVDVVFEVNEGPLTHVERIVFIGNTKFSDSDLQGEIFTSETRFWRFWASDDIYDPDRLSVDQESLRRFYLSEGYADFRVVSAVAELTPAKDAFVLTFTVDEGERYKFGAIEVESRLPAIDAKTLLPLLVATPDDWYNADLINEDIDALTDRIGEAGFAFVTVRPEARPDRTNRVIDLVYEIGEGPRVYVDRIEIIGNIRTEEKVIRREMRLSEGDPFNTSKLRRSRERIRNLGFFDTVDTETVPSSQGDRTNIIVRVTERSTGELSFGVGFSTADGPIGDISLRERNLLGKGQDLRLGLRVSGRTQTIDLSFTEPYFLDRRLSAGFDIFRTDEDNTDESSFETESLGFRLRSGYALTEHTRQNWSYGWTSTDLLPGANSSEFVKEAAGKSSTSSIAHTISWDTRDNRFSPTRGFVLSMTNELAGLGGSERFLKNQFSAAGYYEVFPEVVFSAIGRLGTLNGLGEDTDITQRFFLGGERLRGFAVAGVGPRDLSTDDSIGGNYYYTGTLEAEFPLGLPNDLGIRGRVFTEAGSLFGLDNTQPNGVNVPLGDDASVRASVGVGVSWESPFGPIRVDLGFPVLQESYDKTQTLYFSFGTRF
jgi:outer membrane protein insertion porin family